MRSIINGFLKDISIHQCILNKSNILWKEEHQEHYWSTGCSKGTQKIKVKESYLDTILF